MTTRSNTPKIPSHLSTLIWAAFIYVYIAWGATYMALHFALQTMPPFLIASTRFIIAGGVLLGLLRIFHGSNFYWGDLREWRDALVVGTLFLGGGNGSLAWAQQHVNTSHAALIFGSIPFWIILFDWIRPGGVRPAVRTVIGLAFGFVGLCILVKPSGTTPDTQMETWGKVALLFAACSWAAGAIYSRHVHARGSSLLPIARQMTCGGFVLLAIALVHGDYTGFDVSQVTVASWVGWGYLLFFGSLTGFTAYAWLIRTTSPERVTTISYVNLVVAVFVAWMFGEPMTTRILLGAGIIIGSVVLVLKKRPRKIDEAVPPEA